MRRRWEAINARARGLGTHLVSHAQLAALADAADLRTLAERLRALKVPAAEGEPAAAELDRAVRRRAAADLAVLARWAGGRAEVAAVLYDEEDRRSVRTVLRGAVARTPAADRIGGLIPSPALPERALGELARAPTPAAVAALLAAWRHPFGSALVQAARSAEPDLFALEQALGRAAATRLAAVGRRAGGLLNVYVRETIDLDNALAAVALAGTPEDVKLRDAFLTGGRLISFERFAAAIDSADASAAAARLADAFGRGPLGRAWRAEVANPSALADAALRGRTRALRALAREDPLGPAPLLAFGLALRAQTVDLHRIIWGVALGVPPPFVRRDLVTAA